MSIMLEVSGEKLIDRELLRFSGRMTDAQPAFLAIADLLMDETREQFTSEGRHASGGWKPLKPATVEEKRRQGFRPQILQETGDLMESLSAKGDSSMVLEVRPDSLLFGSKVPYAKYHQTGTRRGLPKRQPLAFTEETKAAATKIIQRWIVEGVL